MKKWIEYEIVDEIPDTPGLYGLKYEDNFVYIGQSNKMKTRVKRHLRGTKDLKSYLTDFKKGERTEEGGVIAIKKMFFIDQHKDDLKFNIMEVPEEDLNAYECFFIQHYKPIFNYAGVMRNYLGMEGRGDIPESEIEFLLIEENFEKWKEWKKRQKNL